MSEYRDTDAKNEPESILSRELDDYDNAELLEHYKYDGESFEYKSDAEDELRGEEWEHEEYTELPDWEKEAKKKIKIQLEEPTKKLKTIFQLESYATSGPTQSDLQKIITDALKPESSRIPSSQSITLDTKDIARIDLSPLTQKIVGCVAGENITTEYPWLYVKKDIIEDNIDLHSESSDFLSVKKEIQAYPDTKVVIGYAPSLTEKGQFYICLTTESKEAISRKIELERAEHEYRVRTAIYKPVGFWKDLGSAAETEELIVKKRRALFEIEIKAPGSILNSEINFTNETPDDEWDESEANESLSEPETFNNIQRKLIDKQMQVILGSQENTTQTVPAICRNAWFQYLYQCSPMNLSKLKPQKLEWLRKFLERHADEMCNQVILNAAWDIYVNDYAALVKCEKDSEPPVQISYKEQQSYHNAKLTGDKVINNLSWHPTWTGVAYLSYSKYAKCNQLTGPRDPNEMVPSFDDNNYVLIWSFGDCLAPKLVLECPREVIAVTTCPLDGTVIIGGCANGQIAIWHIPGKIEEAETVMVETSAQARYRMAMESLTTWIQQLATSTPLVKTSAMSSLKYSQHGPITEIIWQPAHFKVNKNGRISSLPEDTSLEDLNWQFLTASMDGTIAFWDLKSQPREKEIRKPPKRKRKLHEPEILTSSISPYKVLDGIFKPDYVLVLQYPEETRRVIITTISMYTPKFQKEQIEPFPILRDITIRKYFKPIIEKPNFEMQPKILVGTVEGDFGCISWEGFEFTTDVTVNREVCQWTWIKKFHDGPVTSSVRSKYYHNVVATIGGKMFAVWRDDFGEPILSHRSKLEYTACSWGSFRPTVLILARADGTSEIWDFRVKTQEPAFVSSLSGRIITGIYTHELPLEPQCVGFCDFNGILRVFSSPGQFLKYDISDIDWMREFINRQVLRIKEFETWQKNWNETNLKDIEEKKRYQAEMMEAERKQLEAEKRTKAEATERLGNEKKTTKVDKPMEFIRAAHERWKTMELARMQRVLLEKKGLKMEDLDKQRAPILKIRQDARKKKQKIREMLQLRDQIFEEAVAFLFPDQCVEPKKASMLPDIVPVKEKIQKQYDRTTKQPEIDGTAKKDYFADPEAEIIYNFLEVQTEALASLQSRPFEHSFDWRKVLMEGKSRRSSMDAVLRRLNKPKRKSN